MTDEQAAPAGWYSADEGRLRWWDGGSWGPYADSTSSAPPAVHASQPVALGLVPLVLAIVFAPAGLVAGLVSLSRARRARRARPTLSLLAVVFGAFGSVLLGASVFAAIALTNWIDGTERVAAMCERAESDFGLVSDIRSLSDPLNVASARGLNGLLSSAEEREAVVAQITPVRQRLGSVIGNVGGAYVGVFNSGYQVQELLLQYETGLVSGDVLALGYGNVPGDELMRRTDAFEMALRAQCDPGQ